MTDSAFKLLLTLVMVTSFAQGQTLRLDSCGLDKNTRLNKYEAEFLDKVIFADSIHDFKKDFNFINKNIYFFTCNTTVSRDSFIYKDDFFNIIRTSGTRRPRGIFALSEKQKEEVGQVDAVVLIDCKTYSDKELIGELKERVSRLRK